MRNFAHNNTIVVDIRLNSSKIESTKAYSKHYDMGRNWPVCDIDAARTIPRHTKPVRHPSIDDYCRKAWHRCHNRKNRPRIA